MNNNLRNQNYSNNGRINYPSFPTFLRFSTQTMEENRGAYWRSAEDTQTLIPSPTPLGLMSLSLQPPSTFEENALKKLRKEVYNPVPKRISSRLCLYYRDQATSIVNEMAKQKEEEGKRCAVCLEDFEPKEMVMLTPCNHMFHEDCIVPWVKSQGQCPVCRFSIWDPNGTSGPNTDLISILRAMGAM